MTKLYFLGSSVPLAKRFSLDAHGQIEKHPYPHVKNFTSYEEQCTDLKEIFAAISKHAALGHCLLKGVISAPLKNQSRAGATRSEDPTDWLCLDLDHAPYRTHQEFIANTPVFKGISYIVQYSASHGLPDATGLSCHIYMLLNKPHNVSAIKAWLYHMNLTNPNLRAALTLTRSNAYLHWPLDVTTCQNDKLIYIASPIVDKDVSYKLSKTELIQYIPAAQPCLNVAVMKCDSIEKSTKDYKEIINAKRKELHIDPLRTQTRMVKDFIVQSKPGVASITGIKESRGFVYFNINGGDSWGYYHPESDYEYIHNFKGEPSYKTSEIFPDYYRQCREVQIKDNAEPTKDGQLILGVRNRKTSELHNIVWNPQTYELEVLPARTLTLLDHFLQGYGKRGYAELNLPVPTWTLIFDPQSNTVVDETVKVINKFIPSPYMRATRKPAKNLSKAPLIERILLSAVSANEYSETTEHFLNWLAVIFQYKIKTTTAWILHGTEGTGKQLLVNKVIRPLLGEQVVVARRMSELEEKFTGWLECALVAFIDEVQVSSSQRKDIITGDLKNFITDSPVSIRHMGQIAYNAPNYTNFILGSNMPDPVVLPRNDRRYNTGDFQNQRLRVTSKEIDVQLQAELPYFCDYIMQRPADKDQAASVLDTESRRNIMQASRSSIDMVCDAVNDGDLPFLFESMPDNHLLTELHGMNTALPHTYSELMKREARKLASMGRETRTGNLCIDGKLSRDELNVIFQYCIGNMPSSPNKFTRLLKYHGLVTKRLRHSDDGVTYGIEPLWTVTKKWLTDHREMFMEQPARLRSVKK